MKASPEVVLIAIVGHQEATTWNEEWRSIDAVLVDAADEDRAGDQFPGVAVVRRVRQCQGEGRPVVTVVTGHFFNDGLRHRMARAGADFFFLRADLRSSAALLDVVLHPEHYRRGVPSIIDSAGARAIGVTESSQIEALVDYVNSHGLEAALDPESPRRADPRGRRWLRHRRDMADVATVKPVNLTTGFAPCGNQATPSLRQLRRIYGWAAKIRGRAGPGLPMTQERSRSDDRDEPTN